MEHERLPMCVQEEERLRVENKDSVSQVNSPRNKRKFQANYKSKKKLLFVAKHDKIAQRAPQAPALFIPNTEETKDDGCHFCNKKGYYQKDYSGFLKQHARKSNNIITFINECSYVNFSRISLTQVSLCTLSTHYRHSIRENNKRGEQSLRITNIRKMKLKSSYHFHQYQITASFFNFIMFSYSFHQKESFFSFPIGPL